MNRAAWAMTVVFFCLLGAAFVFALIGLHAWFEPLLAVLRPTR